MTNGIYKPRQPKPVHSIEDLHDAVQTFPPKKSATAFIDEAEEVAKAIIQSSKAGKWEAGNGDEGETVADAKQLQSLCGLARQALSLGDASRAMLIGHDIGRVIERIGIRPFEAYVASARKQLERDNKGGAPKKADIPDEVFHREVAELIDQGFGLMKACEKVAKPHFVSKETVRRAYLRVKA
jgi:hypothetical protein